MLAVAAKSFVVGLDAWMVLLGAIPDVAVGDVVRFAIRAIPVVAAPGGDAAAEPQRLGLNYYAIGGSLQRDGRGSQQLCTPLGVFRVRDGVIPAFWEGHTVSGEFEILVDAEAPRGEQGQHPWRVLSITRETSNWRDRRTEENRPIGPGRRLLKFSELIRRPGLRYQGSIVDRTSAFADDGGLAHYNLEVVPVVD